MKSQVETFLHPVFGEINIIMNDGQPWFVGKDVAGVLGYRRASGAVSRHVEVRDTKRLSLEYGGQQRSMLLINESGLYALVLSSKLSLAMEFKRWVTGVVLPTLRRHGVFMTDTTLDSLADDPDKVRRLADALSKERAAREESEECCRDLSLRMAQMTTKADYYDSILACPDAFRVSQIAQEYGCSAVRFNQILQKLGIQHNVNGQWILNSPYANRGYVRNFTFMMQYSDGTQYCKMQTLWTSKGRAFLYEKLTAEGYNPEMAV